MGQPAVKVDGEALGRCTRAASGGSEGSGRGQCRVRGDESWRTECMRGRSCSTELTSASWYSRVSLRSSLSRTGRRSERENAQRKKSTILDSLFRVPAGGVRHCAIVSKAAVMDREAKLRKEVAGCLLSSHPSSLSSSFLSEQSSKTTH